MPELTKCDLRYLCHRTWEELLATADAKVRYCDLCARNVFALRTRAQLSVANAVGRCVALTDDNEIVGWIGEPEGSWDWMEEESEMLRIRFGHDLTSAVIERLQVAFPRVSETGIAWLPGHWITLGTFTPYVARNIANEIREQFPGLEIASGPGRDTVAG